MKTTFTIIVMILVAAFYGCQKSDVLPGVSSSVSSDGVISGTIVNDSNRIDSIIFYDYDENSNNSIIIGKSTVSSAGKFSLVLTNLVLRKLGNVPSGVVVSDTTSMVVNVDEVEAYKDGISTGNISKSNLSNGDSIKTGESKSLFMYSDRAFSIKGTEIEVDTNNGVTSNVKVNYSTSYKKG